jgi:hypothetical protein
LREWERERKSKIKFEGLKKITRQHIDTISLVSFIIALVVEGSQTMIWKDVAIKIQECGS